MIQSLFFLAATERLDDKVVRLLDGSKVLELRDGGKKVADSADPGPNGTSTYSERLSKTSICWVRQPKGFG
jgi:hypothetical protein